MSIPKQLFEEIERVYTGPRDQSEPTFDYINRSGRPEYSRIREILEDWFRKYPAEEIQKLKKRLQSGDEGFYSAFFELYLYNLLFQLGFEVEIHPFREEQKSRIDFKVSQDGRPLFYLEAKTILPSKEEIALKKIEGQFFDYLNKHLKSRDFFIGLKIIKQSHSSPTSSYICQSIQKELDSLNYDEITYLYKENGEVKLPQWIFEDKGWKIIFWPIPKKYEERNVIHNRSIYIVDYEDNSFLINLDTKIRKAIVGKSTKYGKLELPYIVAINILDKSEFCDIEDIHRALFGISPPSEVENYKGKLRGVWWYNGAPQNRRISAVFVTINLTHCYIAQIAPIVWCNPWAEKPLSFNGYKLINWLNEKDKFKVGKINTCEILSLDRNWPYWEF